jgi:hypothetical protein
MTLLGFCPRESGQFSQEIWDDKAQNKEVESWQTKTLSTVMVERVSITTGPDVRHVSR